MHFSDIYNHMWSDRPIRLNKMTSVLCEPGWRWNHLTIKDFDAWFVWTGRGWATCREQRFELMPGAVICFQPGNTYCAGHDPDNRMGICVFRFDVIDDAGRALRLPAKQMPPHWGRIGAIDLHERLLKHAAALYHSGDPEAQEEATMYVRGVLRALQRSTRQPALSGTQKEHHDAVWAVARQVRENPGEAFSIESLADRTGYSADHFSRLFKRIVGLTPKEFCVRTRLERAQTLLRESAMSVEQIARVLGYSDMFFFSRQFKKRFGASPSRWRACGDDEAGGRGRVQ